LPTASYTKQVTQNELHKTSHIKRVT